MRYVPVLTVENSSVTSVTTVAAVVVNLPTKTPPPVPNPTPLVAVVPGYLYEYELLVTFNGMVRLLFDATSSGGTETVIVSLPIADGLNGTKLTVDAPSHVASDGIISVSAKV